jgi:hypothetical protein
MTEQEEMADYEARAEKSYSAMYDAAPHNVKDCYEDASLYLSNAIKLARKLGLAAEAERVAARAAHIDNVYNSQFRYAGR